MNYICVSEDKVAKNFKDEIIGTTGKRALFYTPSIGRRKIYRRGFNEQSKKFKYLEFKSQEKAQEMCEDINETYGDDFKIEKINI